MYLGKLDFCARRFNNQVKGSIPESIGGLSELQVLLLQETGVSGQLPSGLGKLKNLINLQVFDTNITGDLKWLEELAKSSPSSPLEILWLQNTSLSGSIPPAIGGLSKLAELVPFFIAFLRGDSFTTPLFFLPRVKLHDTELHGTLPPDIGKLPNLRVLLAFNTNLEGEIPEQLGRDVSLLYLHLWNTKLEGTLPASIGSLINLKVCTTTQSPMQCRRPSIS